MSTSQNNLADVGEAPSFNIFLQNENENEKVTTSTLPKRGKNKLKRAIPNEETDSEQSRKKKKTNNDVVEKLERAPMGLQIRSGLRCFCSTILKYKAIIPSDTYTVLEDTPFGKMVWLFVNGKMTLKDVTKTQEDIHRMVKFWSRDDDGFKIGGVVHKINPADVKRIFGLPCTGLTPSLETQASRPKGVPFLDKYFPTNDRITNTMLKTALKIAIADQEPEHIAILLIMELLSTFFFANTCSSISYALVKLCIDVKSMKKIAWAEMVLKALKSSLNNGCNQMSGCLPLIMYWVADRTNIVQRVQERAKVKLTFAHWRLKEVHKAFSNMTDEELASSFNCKEEKMMEAFTDGLKTSIFYCEDVEEDISAPTFDLWKIICKDEMKSREKEAQENIVEIIDSFKASQSTSKGTPRKGKNKVIPHDEVMEFIDMIYEEHKKILKQSETWWDLVGKIQEEKEKCDKKVEVLTRKLQGKWKIWTELEKEKNELLRLLGVERAKNLKMVDFVRQFQNGMKEKDVLNSQTPITLDEDDRDCSQNNAEKNKVTLLESDTDTDEEVKRNEQQVPTNEEDWIPLSDPVPPSKTFVETQLPKPKKSSMLSSAIPVQNESGNQSSDSDFVDRPPPKGVLKRRNVTWGSVTPLPNKRQLRSTPNTKENSVPNQRQLRSTPKKVAVAPVSNVDEHQNEVDGNEETNKVCEEEMLGAQDIKLNFGGDWFVKREGSSKGTLNYNGGTIMKFAKQGKIEWSDLMHWIKKTVWWFSLGSMYIWWLDSDNEQIGIIDDYSCEVFLHDCIPDEEGYRNVYIDILDPITKKQISEPDQPVTRASEGDDKEINGKQIRNSKAKKPAQQQTPKTTPVDPQNQATMEIKKVLESLAGTSRNTVEAINQIKSKGKQKSPSSFVKRIKTNKRMSKADKDTMFDYGKKTKKAKGKQEAVTQATNSYATRAKKNLHKK